MKRYMALVILIFVVMFGFKTVSSVSNIDEYLPDPNPDCMILKLKDNHYYVRMIKTGSAKECLERNGWVMDPGVNLGWHQSWSTK